MLFDIKSDLPPKPQIFAPNVMAICDKRHDKKSKQTKSLAGVDVVSPIGVASRSGYLMFFIGK